MLMNTRQGTFFGLGLLLILILFLGTGCGDKDTPSSGGSENDAAETSGANGENENGSSDSEVIPPVASNGPPRVIVTTSHGAFTLELDPTTAPLTTRNFLDYVRAGFYDGVLIDQVEAGEVVYGGTFNQDGEEKLTSRAVPNEAGNGASNVRGTVAMFRAPTRKDSGTSRFFINVSDHIELDHDGETHEAFGYCAFGRVIQGMDVVDAIAQVEAEEKDGAEGWPVIPIVIETMRIQP